MLQYFYLYVHRSVPVILKKKGILFYENLHLLLSSPSSLWRLPLSCCGICASPCCFLKAITAKTVKSILNRYAISRNYKVLENVQLQLDGKTQTIDFVLVGFFGLLFVSALQGEGDFYGDLKEPRWSFVDADHDRKVRFDNPVLEMDKKGRPLPPPDVPEKRCTT